VCLSRPDLGPEFAVSRLLCDPRRSGIRLGGEPRHKSQLLAVRDARLGSACFRRIRFLPRQLGKSASDFDQAAAARAGAKGLGIRLRDRFLALISVHAMPSQSPKSD
jgi:hypothetical protein